MRTLTHIARSPEIKFCSKMRRIFKRVPRLYEVNGIVLANADDVKMYQKEKVDWYLLDMGNEVDMRTVHFHGQTFLCVSDSEK